MKKKSRWYVAEIVERIRVAGDPRTVTHVNFVLVRARDDAAAYSEAERLGRAAEMTYDNPRGKRVTIRFRGLRELHLVHDALEHGGELLFEEHIGAKERFVRPREALSVFRPRRPSPVSYAAGDVMREVDELTKKRSARGSRRHRRR